MTVTKELTDHGADLCAARAQPLPALDESRARSALRGQIAQLERELSRIFAEGFPHLSLDIYGPQRHPASSLLGLGELERERDRLAARRRSA